MNLRTTFFVLVISLGSLKKKLKRFFVMTGLSVRKKKGVSTHVSARRDKRRQQKSEEMGSPSMESVRRTGRENVLGPKDSIGQSNRLLAPAVWPSDLSQRGHRIEIHAARFPTARAHGTVTLGSSTEADRSRS